MTYVVHYTIKHKNKKEEFECACFSQVGYEVSSIIKKPTQDTKFIYNFAKGGIKLDESTNRNYLEFLKRIPEFSPYIDVDAILTTGEWEFPLNASRIHFCVLASLIRAMVEQPQIVKLCAFIEENNLYEHIEKQHKLTEIGILQIYGSQCSNTGHWVSKSPAKILNELDNTYWNITETIYNNPFMDVHKTFNCYAGYNYPKDGIELYPIIDKLAEDLKLSFGYKP